MHSSKKNKNLETYMILDSVFKILRKIQIKWAYINKHT